MGHLMLTMDATPRDIIVPPRAHDFTSFLFCDSYCLGHIPPSGIQITAVTPHAHLQGDLDWRQQPITDTGLRFGVGSRLSGNSHLPVDDSGFWPITEPGFRVGF